MQNDPKKKIKLKSTPFFGANQSANAKSHDGSLSISLFRTATKILLSFISRAAWQHRYYNTKVGHIWRKYVLKGYTPFYFNFFCKNVCTINFTVSFYLYLYLQRREKCFFFKRWVTWLWHNIQRWNGSSTCIVKFPARQANSWRRRASPNPGNWVCVFFFFFSPSYSFSILSQSNAHTHTNKEGAKTRGKAERRQRAVRFTRFLDYRLMFDSGRSFSLKNDLIRPPY